MTDTIKSDLVQRLRDAAKVADQEWRRIFYSAAADEIADLRAQLEAVQADAKRYRALEAAAREELLRPERASCEVLPDMRTHWKLPTLMCSGPVGEFVTFAAAVDALPDAAMQAEGAAR
jgi:hypothetical protein